MVKRQDARRNRAALINAARDQMITRGTGVPLKEIALAAGLGSATLYRHFPTRADLIAAVFGEEIGRCSAQLSRARDISDPWEALSHLLRTVAETELSVPGLAVSVSPTGTAIPAYGALWEEAHDIIDTLTARLRGHGARADLHRGDLWLLLEAVRAATAPSRNATSTAAERLIVLLVEGLRFPTVRNSLAAGAAKRRA